MEDKRPESVRRPASFNPEAATFSPTPTKGLYGPTPPASPPQTAHAPTTFTEESPFRPAPEMRPTYEVYDEPSDSQLSGAQAGQNHTLLENFGLQDIIQALGQARNEAVQNAVFSLQSIDTPVPYPTTGLLSQQRYDPAFSAPEVDELSKTLGLPGVTSIDKTAENSPVRPPNATNVKCDTKTALHDKLIGRALDKPLTANTLAHYMNTHSTSGPTTTAPQTPHSHDSGETPELKSGEYQTTRIIQPPGFSNECPREVLVKEQNLTTNIVQPPPGFSSKRPREVLTKEQNSTMSVASEPKTIPTGPAAFGRARCFSELQSSTNPAQQHQHHHHVPGRRRPRAPTRTKRADQGPEPSAADIYPDDAVYMTSPPQRAAYAPDTYTPRALRKQQAKNAVSGPISAEVHAVKPPTASITTITSPAQQQPSALATSVAATAAIDTFDLFTDHCAPSTADLHAADTQVMALLDVLPLLFTVEDVPDAEVLDERPLTPSQQDGSRYGLQFYGIGLDGWEGAAPERH